MITVNQEKLKEFNKLKKQSEIKKLLSESDYTELPSFLQRKGEETYNIWMTYRQNLRLAYHDLNSDIPKKPLE